MQEDNSKSIPSEGPKNKVFLSAKGEQQLQPDLPIPLSCILHNSLFVKSQRFEHTPEGGQGRERNNYLLSDNKTRPKKKPDSLISSHCNA